MSVFILPSSMNALISGSSIQVSESCLHLAWDQEEVFARL